MNIAIIIAGIQAAIAAAPGVIDIVAKAKDLITSLFTAKVIDKAQQDALHQHIDSIAALVASGIVPAHWTVEPDPVDAASVVKLG